MYTASRSGEISLLDRRAPALPAIECAGTQYAVKHDRDLSLRRRGYFFRRDDRDYLVFCQCRTRCAVL